MNENIVIPSQLLGTCIIVLDKGGKKIMLGKRKKFYGSGYYGLPGGRLEASEKLINCAKRELLEETGLDVNSLEYLGVIRDMHVGYTFTHFAYLCRSYKGEVKVTEPDKCVGWEWFEPGNIPEKTLPGHKAAIDIFLNPGTTNLRDVSSV